MSYTNNLKLFLEKRAGSYSIQLTPEEMDSLDYFAGRGYDCGLKAALQLENEETGTYSIPEHGMWEISEACNEHGAWTNLNWNSSLGVKIDKLLQSIV